MSLQPAARRVSVVGVDMSVFGRFPERSVQDLGWPVVQRAVADAGIRPDEVQAVYCGSAFSGRMVGQRVLRPLGMLGVPVVNVENACSSGSTAFREAVIAIGSGQIDVALVIGIDKLSAFGGGLLPGQAEDWEIAMGMSMPALYAMRARRYMHDHGLSLERLSQVPVKAHRHGALNPYAQFRNEVSLETVVNARPVCEPFTLWHCCPTGDGAAAAVLVSDDYLRRLTAPKPVHVAGTELTSGRYTSGYRDMTVPEITVRGAREIYEAAGLGPKDISLAEVHDAFSIAELLYYEAFGFCAPGDAIDLLEAGETSLGGRIPVNPGGGLLCRGHPVGATGIAQVCEVVWQLRGQAEGRQVENARVGLTHCTGGGITGVDHGACAITILTR